MAANGKQYPYLKTHRLAIISLSHSAAALIPGFYPRDARGSRVAVLRDGALRHVRTALLVELVVLPARLRASPHTLNPTLEAAS